MLLSPQFVNAGLRLDQGLSDGFAGLESVENLSTDRPGSGAPGTLRRRRSRLERCDDSRRRTRLNCDAALAHALVVLLLPGGHREPQLNLGLATRSVDCFPQIRSQLVVDRLIDTRD